MNKKKVKNNLHFAQKKKKVRISGDFEFLRQSIPNRHENGKSYTPLQFLERVATAWLHYPSSADSPWLVDYGANKRYKRSSLSHTYIGYVFIYTNSKIQSVS